MITLLCGGSAVARVLCAVRLRRQIHASNSRSLGYRSRCRGCRKQNRRAGCVCRYGRIRCNGNAHIHAEVVAAGLCGDVQERAVAGFGQGFVEVQVQRGAAVEPVHQFFTVQQEFVERIDFFVFDDVEIGVVAVAADFVAVGFVPFGVFHAEVFGGDKLGVELHAVVFAGGLVGFKYGFQTALNEVDVIVVVADLDALRFGGFRHAVDADGEELFVQRDEACIVNGQHAGGLVFFHQFAVGVLVFVDFGDFSGKVAPVLLQSVHVDGDDVDGTSRHPARTKCVAEGTVFDSIAQATAGSQRIGLSER